MQNDLNQGLISSTEKADAFINKKLPSGKKAKNGRIPVILLITLFFVWGVLNSLNDILVAQFKAVFTLSDFQSGLVQLAFYISYFFFAIPASLLISRFSYKMAILAGLALVCSGALLFYPAASSLLYGSFLVALFVLAAGCAFLETSANPYIALLGGENSTRYLNFAQAFNALGSIIAALIGKYFILNKAVVITAAQAAIMSRSQLNLVHIPAIHRVVNTYMHIAAGVAVIGLLIFFTKYPKIQSKSRLTIKGYRDSLGHLIKKKHFVRGVLAQFCCVGAQICVWSYTVRFCMYSQHMTPGHAATYLLYALIAFACGRFLSTVILKYVLPEKLMGWYAAVNTLLCFYVVFFSGMGTVWALVAMSFCMSIMFPTIFALSIKALGRDVPYASSLIVMSILGGAALTALMGALSDATNIAHAFVIPAICFVYIFGYSFWGSQPGENT